MNILCVCTAGKDRSPAMAKWLMENYPDVDAKAAGISFHRTDHYKTKHVLSSETWDNDVFHKWKGQDAMIHGTDIFITVGSIHYGYLCALRDYLDLETDIPIVVIETLRKARPEQVPEIMEAHRKRIEKAMNKVRGKTDG